MEFGASIRGSASCRSCGAETTLERLRDGGAKSVGRPKLDDPRAVGLEVEMLGGCAFCGGGRFIVVVKVG